MTETWISAHRPVFYNGRGILSAGIQSHLSVRSQLTISYNICVEIYNMVQIVSVAV